MDMCTLACIFFVAYFEAGGKQYGQMMNVPCITYFSQLWAITPANAKQTLHFADEETCEHMLPNMSIRGRTPLIVRLC